MINELETKIKAFINSIRIPSLLSFIVTKDGKLNPTIEESLKEASESKDNWLRLGLDKKVFGLPVWSLLLLPIIMLVVKWGAEALQFFIEIISQGFMLLPLLVIGYFIYRSFKGK